MDSRNTSPDIPVNVTTMSLPSYRSSFAMPATVPQDVSQPLTPATFLPKSCQTGDESQNSFPAEPLSSAPFTPDYTTPNVFGNVSNQAGMFSTVRNVVPAVTTHHMAPTVQPNFSPICTAEVALTLSVEPQVPLFDQTMGSSYVVQQPILPQPSSMILAPKIDAAFPINSTSMILPSPPIVPDVENTLSTSSVTEMNHVLPTMAIPETSKITDRQMHLHPDHIQGEEAFNIHRDIPFPVNGLVHPQPSVAVLKPSTNISETFNSHVKPLGKSITGNHFCIDPSQISAKGLEDRDCRSHIHACTDHIQERHQHFPTIDGASSMKFANDPLLSEVSKKMILIERNSINQSSTVSSYHQATPVRNIFTTDSVSAAPNSFHTSLSPVNSFPHLEERRTHRIFEGSPTLRQCKRGEYIFIFMTKY